MESGGNIPGTAIKAPTTNKEESSSNKKAASSSSSQRQQEQQQQEALKCPRCDSMNTKFCYYNNYSLTQPRHFCKSCRRYWTKGGALRNVPVGGGCRKTKKLKSSSLNLSGDSPTSSDIGRFKFFNNGFSSSSPPTLDFNLGGLSIPRVNISSSPSSGVVYNNQLSNNPSFGELESSFVATNNNNCFNLDPSLGFSFSLPPLYKQQNESNVQYGSGVGTQDEAFVVSNNNHQVAASIESLSSINQDLHWKLQQQRFATMLFGWDNNNHNKEDSNNNNNVSQGFSPSSIEHHQQIQRPQPILFQNLDISPSGGTNQSSRKEAQQNGNFANDFFFEDTSATMNSTRSAISSDNDPNNGVQAWNNLDQFNPLP